MLTDRKTEHLDIVLAGRGQGPGTRTGFDTLAFEHVALPELDMDTIRLDTIFLKRRIKAPLLVSSMTGGPKAAESINQHLAEACERLGIALAVGSQRVAIENEGAGGLSRALRDLAPSIPILANFGAAQLNKGFGIREAERALDMIGADALIIHLNPLQEAVQAGGDRDWRGLLSKIEALAKALPAPMVVKEVGSGISARLAKQLVDAGVHAIDVAGAGGTSWARVEGERGRDPVQRAVALALADWGQPTADAIREVRAAVPDAVVIGSGGVRDGLDVAKAIRLGADIVGQAAGVLQAAVDSADAVVRHFETVIETLRVVCFCTGSADLSALRRAALRQD